MDCGQGGLSPIAVAIINPRRGIYICRGRESNDRNQRPPALKYTDLLKLVSEKMENNVGKGENIPFPRCLQRLLVIVNCNKTLPHNPNFNYNKGY